jgi:hypothetical protein
MVKTHKQVKKRLLDDLADDESVEESSSNVVLTATHFGSEGKRQQLS